MTHQNDYNLPEQTLEELTRQGMEAVPELIRILLNNVMQVERAKYLQAGEYERSENRQGHANGYKPKTVKTRLGEIPLLARSRVEIVGQVTTSLGRLTGVQ